MIVCHFFRFRSIVVTDSDFEITYQILIYFPFRKVHALCLSSDICTLYCGLIHDSKGKPETKLLYLWYNHVIFRVRLVPVSKINQTFPPLLA